MSTTLSGMMLTVILPQKAVKGIIRTSEKEKVTAVSQDNVKEDPENMEKGTGDMLSSV